METIGIFFGGKSPEHDISIITGQLIISGLKGMGFTVVAVYLDKENRWHLGDQYSSMQFFRGNQASSKKTGDYAIDLAESSGKIVFRKNGWGNKKINIDLAFPAFHGRYGEDGTMQGLFEMFGIPYVGCDVTSSALTMDKVFTKELYRDLGLPTSKFLSINKKDWQNQQRDLKEKIASQLRGPLFVKPARLGSSIGIAKISNPQELEQAIEVALHYDDKVIIEESVENVMDITCAVLGNDDLTSSLLQESNFKEKFFSYEDKYLNDGGAQLGKSENNMIIPAGLDAPTTQKIQEMAKTVFKAFGCSGLARVDFLYNKKTKDIFVNEVNTLPGTLYHHLWKKSGIELPNLLQRLLDLARERHHYRQKFISTFESSVLKQADWSNKLGPKGA